ncbi:peptidase S8 and S53 subtilisin kexin sedolisin [Emticicia oligotrophica DSM 17448]|uniref:Peptidase S8 and S53 subtilisin kexin sedolisin n=1 Tax=Emticicia oligotrophica (strain DSM 17448 / CIP 109782 / MTCC 6937 / GPTSA100-15) TaxID=929562 RepID=A0ABM5N302_EMTOG|nr:S8 family peptidase [Emticicia oligotrophica]AFK03801.1 peptidase S8 and S53 subtilisin kexin sedolisin [Emticicia oligotrophica DSM 17448]
MRKLIRTLASILSLGVFMTSCTSEIIEVSDSKSSSTTNQRSAARTTAQNFEPNEVLVKFKTGVSESKKSEILDKIGGKLKEKILTKLMERFGDNDGIQLVQIPMNALEAIARVKDLGEIEYIEPNYIYTHDAVSNDPYFTNGSLWGMYGSTTSPANQFGSNAAVAWANGKTGTNTVYIGIIDEGYMYTHEDLAANAGVNPGEISGNGRDDDGNGLVDDVYGWDFDGNNNTVFDGTGDDHGTHVAGTIGGVGGNGIGVAGVCWNVKLLSAKFLGSRGGTTANAIKAVDYFTDLKIRSGLNIVATNNSWGGGGFSQALQDAITRANNAGILFIAAAGNNSSNNDATANYPSNYNVPNVIAVASITNTGGLSSFSNYGATQVDLGAPGSGIFSTVPASSKGKIISSYASYNGTSMATPHVTGAAALYASVNAGASAATIKNAILSSVTPTASLSGKCVTGGRLNVGSF